MEKENRIKNLEKENAELKKDFDLQNKIIKEISESKDLNTVTDNVISYLRKLFYFEGFSVYVHYEDSNMLKCIKHYNPSNNGFANSFYKKRKIDIKTSESWTVKCFKKARPIYINDIKNEKMSLSKKELLNKLNVASILMIPIVKDKKSIGVIVVRSYKKSLDYSKKDIQKMQGYLRQFNLLIDIALNKKILQERTSSLNSSVKQLEALVEYSAKLNSSFNIGDVFTIALNCLSSLTGFERISIYLRSKDAYELICKKERDVNGYSSKNIEPLNKRISLKNKSLSSVKAFLNMKYIYLSEVNDKHKLIEEQKGAASIFICPMVVRNEAIGIIYMSSFAGKVFLSKQDVSSILMFTEQVASVVKNILLFEESHGRRIKMERAFSELEKLQMLNNLVNKRLDVDDVFNVIVSELIKLYDFEAFSLLLVNEGKSEYKVRSYFSTIPLGKEMLEVHSLSFPLNIEEGGRIAQSILENKIFYYSDVKKIKDELDDINKEAAKRLGLRSTLILPIEISGDVIGAINIINFSKSLDFSKSDINTIKRFTQHIAHSIHNSKLYEEVAHGKKLLEDKDALITEELEVAKGLQKAILGTDFSSIKGIKIYIKYSPVMSVGGDFYDIALLSEKVLRVFIADLTGHGVQAALMTMLLKAEYEKIKENALNPLELMEKLNSEYVKKYFSLNVFFTGFAIDIDLNEKKATYSSAGHPEQFFVDKKNGEVKKLKSAGTIIGFEQNVKFSQETIDFLPGDKLILFTDGLFEEFDIKDDEPIGEKVLHSIALKALKLDGKALHEKIYSDMSSKVGENGFHDDLLLLTLEIE